MRAGSHYSSAGVALFYLLRLEPFTALAVALQVWPAGTPAGLLPPCFGWGLRVACFDACV